MHIEQELKEWLTSYIPDKKNKIRNIKAILNYYGFGELAWPTLEEIDVRLSIGTRERVRQVINENFKNFVKLLELPVASRIFELIQSYECVPIPNVRAQLAKEGLGSENTTLRGLLNLARDLNTCEGYDLYDSSLEKLSRSEAEFDSRTFLIHEQTLAGLKKNLKKARTLPGLLGIAKFDYLRSELGDGVETDRVIQFVRGGTDACILFDKGEEWYLFEDRDNTLINSCEKIYSLTEQCKLGILAETIQNSLRRRSHKYDYPEANLISAWIERSKWFLIENNQATKFLGEKRKLSEIETAVVAYLKDRKNSNYPEFRDHLLGLGYGKPAVDKVITTSPLVTVDKTGRRTNYTYQLIEKAAKVENEAEASLSRYQIFRNRLKRVLAVGTDSMGESIVRREQTLLREWLFDNQNVSECAICGQIYSIAALVTAHKKKRASCNDAERVDPYIVFPLCKFGCDYLYEIGMLRIEEGVVQMAKASDTSTIDSKRASELVGREIDKKWLSGDAAYFISNLTIRPT